MLNSYLQLCTLNLNSQNYNYNPVDAYNASIILKCLYTPIMLKIMPALSISAGHSTHSPCFICRSYILEISPLRDLISSSCILRRDFKGGEISRAATSPLTRLAPASRTLNPTTLFHAVRFRGRHLLEPTSL